MSQSTEYSGPPDAPPPVAAPTSAALIAPSLAVASCVRGYVTRSTLGADLSPQQRQNHYPASPLCSISWLLQGESIIIQRGDTPVNERASAITFLGPHTVPGITANPGPVQVFMLVLFPPAVQAMTGLDIAALVNRPVPLESVLDAAWIAMAQAVQQARDDAARVQLIEAFLVPRWHAVSTNAMPRMDRHRHWVEALALQAATSGVGKSLRQMERRIKEWAGLPLRDLRRLARTDASFVDTRNAYVADTANRSPNWADVAADGGFSDQSHFCRESRRVTGLSPNELLRAVEEEESFWIYRIWD